MSMRDDFQPERGSATGKDGSGKSGLKSQISSAASTAKDQVSSVAAKAKEQVSSVASTAKEQIASVAAVAKEQAGTFIDPMKEKALNMVEEKKQTGVEQIGKVAQAVHAAASQIEREIPQAATYIHRAAEGLEQASQAISNRSVGDMVDYVEDFARRNPAAFFGSTVLAGFVLSRFLKSSSERRAELRGPDGTRPAQQYGGMGSQSAMGGDGA
jgi:hypothetical protein